MKKIDWTKPVRVKDDHREVHVVTTDYRETPDSQPLVLVTINNHFGSADGWSLPPLKRAQDGSYLRCEGNRGSAVVLENVPEKESIFVRVSPHGLSLHRSPPGGPIVVDIELVYENGIAVEAKLHNANEEGHEHLLNGPGTKYDGRLTFYGEE